MIVHQYEDKFDVSKCFDEDTIRDRIFFKRSEIKFRVKTMDIIENLPVDNANISP